MFPFTEDREILGKGFFKAVAAFSTTVFLTCISFHGYF